MEKRPKYVYRVNVGCQNEESKIGEILEYVFYDVRRDGSIEYRETEYLNNKLIIGHCIYISKEKLDAQQGVINYLNNLSNNFFVYCFNKEIAIKLATESKEKLQNQQWNYKTLLDAIKNHNGLKSLGYQYKITNTYTQINKTLLESIYISPYWRITLDQQNKTRIMLWCSGWRIYGIYTLDCLFNVLNAENVDEHISTETKRLKFAEIISNHH